MLSKREEYKYAIELSLILAALMMLAWFFSQHQQQRPYRIAESRFVQE